MYKRLNTGTVASQNLKDRSPPPSEGGMEGRRHDAITLPPHLASATVVMGFPLDFRPLPLLLGPGQIRIWNNHDFMTWYSTECRKCFYWIQSREFILQADISWGELSHVIISTSSDKIQDCMKIHAEEARHLMVFGNSERRDESTDDRLLMKVINKLILTRIK